MTNRMKSFAIAIAILALVGAAAYAQTASTLALSGTIPTSIQVSLDGVTAGGSHSYALPAIATNGTFASADTGFDLMYMSNAAACTVTVTSANDDGTNLRLANGSNYIQYSLNIGSYACTEGGTPINAAGAAYAWAAPALGSDITIANAIAVAGLPAGSYTDTLTFTITAP